MLQQMGISSGWVLMSVPEMFALKKPMDSASAENERLNKQTAQLIARRMTELATIDIGLRLVKTLLANPLDNKEQRLAGIVAVDEVIAKLWSANPDQKPE